MLGVEPNYPHHSLVAHLVIDRTCTHFSDFALKGCTNLFEGLSAPLSTVILGWNAILQFRDSSPYYTNHKSTLQLEAEEIESSTLTLQGSVACLGTCAPIKLMA